MRPASYGVAGVRELREKLFSGGANGSPTLGLWGSLVYPSGFGSLRRQFKSAQPHSRPPGHRGVVMVRGKRLTEREWHRKMAAKEFNVVWSLLEKKRRTKEEDASMIHAAHSSRHHWGLVGKPVNIAIGEWQISHVYAVLRRPEPSLYHAALSLDTCRRNRVGDFALAFAYEALARASSLAGDRVARDRYLAKARRAGEKIREEEDRKLFFSDLASIPGGRVH